jgi:hypothetical protein
MGELVLLPTKECRFSDLSSRPGNETETDITPIERCSSGFERAAQMDAVMGISLRQRRIEIVPDEDVSRERKGASFSGHSEELEPKPFLPFRVCQSLFLSTNDIGAR